MTFDIVTYVLLLILIYLQYRQNADVSQQLGKILEKMKRGERVSASPRFNVSVPAPPPAHKNLCQVFKKEGEKLAHIGWVRSNSTAWKKVYDTKGLVLKDSAGKIEEGIQ